MNRGIPDFTECRWCRSGTRISRIYRPLPVVSSTCILTCIQTRWLPPTDGHLPPRLYQIRKKSRNKKRGTAQHRPFSYCVLCIFTTASFRAATLSAKPAPSLDKLAPSASRSVHLASRFRKGVQESELALDSSAR